MTTQDTHDEYNDVDASVVEHPSAPEHELAVDSTLSETVQPAAGEEGKPSPTSAPDVEDKAEAHHEAPALTEAVEPIVSSEIPGASTETHETPAVETAEAEVQEAPSALAPDVAEAEQMTPVEQAAEAPTATIDASTTEASLHTPEVEQQTEEGQIDQAVETRQQVLAGLSEALTDVLSTMEPVALLDEGTPDASTAKGDNIQPAEELTLPTDGVPALADPKAEEVRPFTDFIAEFRQAEAALRDSQVEALSILSSVAADLAFVEPQAVEITTFEDVKRSDVGETTDKEDGVQVKIDETNVSSSSPERDVQAGVEATDTTDTAEKNAPPVQPTARPVSPLLRPASRLRLPRHNVTRHQREEMAIENQAETQSAKVEPAQPGSAEPAVEAPRPARRYRFDRPSTLNNGSNGTSPVVSTADNQPAANGTGTQPRPEEATKVDQPALEQPVEPAKPAAQETSTPTVDHSRRRHTSHKEQPVSPQAALPVVEPTVQETEPVVQPDEIAPEDLPPLEYSELQKASSRRRRRHRSGSTSIPPVSAAAAVTSIPNPVTSQPVAPATPSTQVVAQPPAPVTMPVPTAPAARSITSEPNQSSYTIVSGYTVNQMNQGNDLSGPFMGPDPSPARGSVMSRDGRTVRAETRTTQPTAPIYPPSRQAENGISTAAMTQFANVVSQALQTQTDRMVSEFRRISQAPTNVSVTLPPFPSTERVGVFVDVANLLYSARTLRIGVDFGKLLDFLRGNRRLVRAHAYCPTSPQPSDEQMFLQAVKGLGYRITTKNYKTFSSGAKKADLDLDLCMDVVRLVDGSAVDCVVLVSGDSDFMPMLDYCSDHGVRVEVAAFDEAMSATLRQSCDLFINLSMLDEIRA